MRFKYDNITLISTTVIFRLKLGFDAYVKKKKQLNGVWCDVPALRRAPLQTVLRPDPRTMSHLFYKREKLLIIRVLIYDEDKTP